MMRKFKYKEFNCSECDKIVYIGYNPRGLGQESHKDSPNDGMLIGKKCFCRDCACRDDDLTLESYLESIVRPSNLSKIKKHTPDNGDFVEISSFSKLLSKRMKENGIVYLNPYNNDYQ